LGSGQIFIWSIKDDLKCIKSTQEIHECYYSGLFLIKNDYFVSGPYCKTFKIWSAKEPYECFKVFNEDSDITLIFVTRNNRIITFTYGQKNFNVWVPSV
jgi:WD40 repeat protein